MTLEGMNIAVTGAMNMGSRSVVRSFILENSGNFSSTVRRDSTTHLVIGNRPGQRKQDDATRWGIITITENELVRQARTSRRITSTTTTARTNGFDSDQGGNVPPVKVELKTKSRADRIKFKELF